MKFPFLNICTNGRYGSLTLKFCDGRKIFLTKLPQPLFSPGFVFSIPAHHGAPQQNRGNFHHV